MAKEPEVPGQDTNLPPEDLNLLGTVEPTWPCQKCGAPMTKAQGGMIFTVCDECWGSDRSVRQLSCGCWVAMEHTGACAVHGDDVGITEQWRKICEQCAGEPGWPRAVEVGPAEQGPPTWLDEVAKDRQGEVMTFLVQLHPDILWGDLCDRSASMAYDAAQALLDEGKKRREAKMPLERAQMPQERSEGPE